MPADVRRVGSPAALRLAAAFAAMVVASTVIALGARPADAHTPHDTIVDVAVSPAYAQNRTVLAISDNRVLRSTDGGRHFRETLAGLDPSVAMAHFGFAPSMPDVVYLTSRGAGIYRSDDGGVHWRTTADSADSRNTADISVSPGSPDVVVAREGLFGGVVRTDDGGGSWSLVPGMYGVGALDFVPDQDHRVVAGDARGVMHVSDDDGRTFQARATPAGTTGITAVVAGDDGVVFAGTKNGVVLRSTDAGDTWSRVGRPLTGPPVDALLLSRSYARDRTVWASTWHGGAFRSTDAGSTWKATGRGLTSDVQADAIRSPQYRSLAVAPERSRQRLFLAGYDGLFVSESRGARWTEVQTQADYVTGLAVSPAYGSDHTVVVNTYVKGAFVSRNGGASFTPSDHGLRYRGGLSEGNKVLPIRRMHNVVFSPAYAQDHTIFTATWTKFVTSVDGGRHWKSVTVAPAPPETALRQFVIAVSPEYARDRTIYLGTHQGDLYRSTRGGRAGSWKTVADLGVWIRSLAISPRFGQDHTMFAGTERGVMKSTDAGSTWTPTGPKELALLAMSPDFPNDQTLFAGTRHGLEVTHDGGRTWTTTGLGPRTPPRAVAAVAVSPAFARDHTVLASIDGTGLFRSLDGGRTFAAVGRDLTRRGLVIVDFDRPTSEPIQFSSVFATDHTVFAYAQESVLRSTNGGRTWQVLALPSAASFHPSGHG